MPFEFEKMTVPVDTDWVPALMPKGVSAGKDALAVTMELFDIPKETLFEFEKTTVPEVASWVPAETMTPPPAPPAAPMIERVMDPAFVEPERVMLLEPTSTRRPVTTPVSPTVFPRLLLPPEN
jgi:hypothetical protein